MTDKPNIAALRIDERLVHGQGQLWIKTLGVNTVIVANDEAANDPIQQTLMKTVIPKTIAMRFFTVQHTCDVIYKASPKQVMFIPVRCTEAGRGRCSGDRDQCGKYPQSTGKTGDQPIHCTWGRRQGCAPNSEREIQRYTQYKINTNGCGYSIQC